jgi:hypothetical protein
VGNSSQTDSGSEGKSERARERLRRMRRS